MTSQNPGTIFITGASSGLGRASAKLFSSRGWTVVATMRTPSKESELAALPNVVLLALDITDPQQIGEAASATLARGDVDVVFNNAGYGMAGPLEGVTDEQMLRMVYTNLMGPIRVTKAFTPHFREKRGGLFINTTSIGGLMTVPLNSMYHATKWALEGWSEGMAFELSQFGIGLKIIEPGGMKTDFFTRSFDAGRVILFHLFGGRKLRFSDLERAIPAISQKVPVSWSSLSRMCFGPTTCGYISACGGPNGEVLSNWDESSTRCTRLHPKRAISL